MTEQNSRFTLVLTYLEKLISKTITRVNRGERWHNPLAIALHEENKKQTIGGWGFSIRDSMWRVETQSKFLCGCLDNKQKIDTTLTVLVGRTLKHIELQNHIYDVLLDFDGIYLRLLPLASIKTTYWAAYLPQSRLIAGPNDEWKVEQR